MVTYEMIMSASGRTISASGDRSYLYKVFGQTGMSKQRRPRSDATKRGVWSGSTMFATQPAILDTWTRSNKNMFNFL